MAGVGRRFVVWKKVRIECCRARSFRGLSAIRSRPIPRGIGRPDIARERDADTCAVANTLADTSRLNLDSRLLVTDKRIVGRLAGPRSRRGDARVRIRAPDARTMASLPRPERPSRDSYAGR